MGALCFDEAEAGRFLLDVAGLDLRGDEVAELWSSTDGWVAALQLACVSLRRSGRPVRHDHQSLAHMPTEQLDSVIQLLLDSNYDGLLTLEIFGEADFTSSLEALMKSIKRVCSRNRCDNYS